MMNSRERILELVSKDVLSVEEGLNLLENLSDLETKKTEEKEFASDKSKVKKIKEKTEPSEEDTVDKKEKKDIEDELELLANQINQYSVGIDILNKDLTMLKLELVEIEEKLTERKETENRNYLQTKNQLENKIVDLNKEIELISLLDEIDNHLEIVSLKKELRESVEELSGLENQTTMNQEITELENKAEVLSADIKKITAEKNKRMKDMHSLKMKRWTNKAKQISENIDIPKEWRTGASETIDKVGEIFDSSSQTLTEILRETVKKTKDTIENIDWQDIKVDFSEKEKASFDHEWLYENTSASILDLKNANGDVEFKPSINDNIKVSAKIKIYGNIDESSPLEALKARTVIDIDEDKFIFQNSDKNIKVDLTIYLPQRNYDYIRLNYFNGDIKFDELLARDVYVKVAAGDIVFSHLEASMLEVESTKGDVTLNNTQLRDLLLTTVKGNIRVLGDIQSLDASTVDGEVRLTLSGDDLIRATASSVRGDIKLSVPKEISLEIEAKTTLGKVKSRLSETETLRASKEKKQSHRFFRLASGEIFRAKLQTTTGNILLKDMDKNIKGKGE